MLHRRRRMWKTLNPKYSKRKGIDRFSNLKKADSNVRTYADSDMGKMDAHFALGKKIDLAFYLGQNKFILGEDVSGKLTALALVENNHAPLAGK